MEGEVDVGPVNATIPPLVTALAAVAVVIVVRICSLSRS
jgi:hypothetical protein